MNKDWRVSFIKNLQLILDQEDYSKLNARISFLCQPKNQEQSQGNPNFIMDFYEVIVDFKNVSNIKLEFMTTGIIQIAGFDILDISKNGWENINYEIEDYENGAIGFYCKEYNIVSVSDPKPLKL